MSEKRYTLRMSEALFDIAKSCAHKQNRSIAKEIELSLARYYFLLPLMDIIFKDYQFNIKDINEGNLSEHRELIMHELEEVLKNYPNSFGKHI